MGRSTKKGPFVDPKLMRKVIAQKDSGDQKPIKTWARACTITPDFVGHKFAVHTGKIFVSVLVSEDMVGHKLGEFASSRTFRSHTKKKTKR